MKFFSPRPGELWIDAIIGRWFPVIAIVLAYSALMTSCDGILSPTATSTATAECIPCPDPSAHTLATATPTPTSANALSVSISLGPAGPVKSYFTVETVAGGSPPYAMVVTTGGFVSVSRDPLVVGEQIDLAGPQDYTVTVRSADGQEWVQGIHIDS